MGGALAASSVRSGSDRGAGRTNGLQSPAEGGCRRHRLAPLRDRPASFLDTHQEPARATDRVPGRARRRLPVAMDFGPARRQGIPVAGRAPHDARAGGLADLFRGRSCQSRWRGSGKLRHRTSGHATRPASAGDARHHCGAARAALRMHRGRAVDECGGAIPAAGLGPLRSYAAPEAGHAVLSLLGAERRSTHCRRQGSRPAR